MTRTCFFVPEIVQDTGEIFDLPPQLSRQLESVLRARTGGSIELLDAKGSAWSCLITGVRGGTVSVRLIGKLDRTLYESPLRITLGLGMARSDTMDLVVRQAVEMGVRRLAVFRARRSQYGLSGEQAAKKKERWLKIAAEAICQCGRAKVPEIEIFEDLDLFLASVESKDGDAGRNLKVFALERESGTGLAESRAPRRTEDSTGLGRYRARRRVGQRGKFFVDRRRVYAGGPWPKNTQAGNGRCGACLLHTAPVGRYEGKAGR